MRKNQKKKKLTTNFYFKDKTHEEIIKELDEKFPIYRSSNQKDLIDRIHTKYPVISKEEIKTVVLGIMQCIRDCLISGDIITISNLFLDAKIDFTYTDNYYGVLSNLKVKIITPSGLRR